MPDFMVFGGIQFQVYYVQEDATTPGIGETPWEPLTTVTWVGGDDLSNRVYLFRNNGTSAPVIGSSSSATANINNTVTTNLIFLGMPRNSTEPMWASLPSNAKTAWGASDASYHTSNPGKKARVAFSGLNLNMQFSNANIHLFGMQDIAFEIPNSPAFSTSNVAYFNVSGAQANYGRRFCLDCEFYAPGHIMNSGTDPLTVWGQIGTNAFMSFNGDCNNVEIRRNKFLHPGGNNVRGDNGTTIGLVHVNAASASVAVTDNEIWEGTQHHNTSSGQGRPTSPAIVIQNSRTTTCTRNIYRAVHTLRATSAAVHIRPFVHILATRDVIATNLSAKIARAYDNTWPTALTWNGPIISVRGDFSRIVVDQIEVDTGNCWSFATNTVNSYSGLGMHVDIQGGATESAPFVDTKIDNIEVKVPSSLGIGTIAMGTGAALGLRRVSVLPTQPLNWKLQNHPTGIALAWQNSGATDSTTTQFDAPSVPIKIAHPISGAININRIPYLEVDGLTIEGRAAIDAALSTIVVDDLNLTNRIYVGNLVSNASRSCVVIGTCNADMPFDVGPTFAGTGLECVIVKNERGVEGRWMAFTSGTGINRTRGMIWTLARTGGAVASYRLVSGSADNRQLPIGFPGLKNFQVTFTNSSGTIVAYVAVGQQFKNHADYMAFPQQTLNKLLSMVVTRQTEVAPGILRNEIIVSNSTNWFADSSVWTGEIQSLDSWCVKVPLINLPSGNGRIVDVRFEYTSFIAGELFLDPQLMVE